MKHIRVLQLDSFTRTPGTGNPAGVVPDAHGLTKRQMRVIAKEMNCSETAFLFHDPRDPHRCAIRYFSPTHEIPLCGHATIAAFHVIMSDRFPAENTDSVESYALKTKTGTLRVVTMISDRKRTVWMQLPVPRFTHTRIKKDGLARILGCSPLAFRNDIPAVINDDSMIVPMRSLGDLKTISPDMRKLKIYLAGKNLQGLSLFTTETYEKRSSVHSRYFAPGVGIQEDPVTGSLNGPLGAYLLKYGLISAEKDEVLLIGEQGDIIGRPGRVHIQVVHDDLDIKRVLIGGEAVVVFEGTFSIPAKS